jgi:SulP family sulfate permease
MPSTVRRFISPSLPDLLAGISVALVLVPQSLAYAELAGLPAVVGLTSAALAPLAAALFASSPALQTGPTAMAAVLVLAVLGGGVISDSGDPTAVASTAALLALMVGVVRVVLGLLRAGALAYILSGPVLRGFTLGAALLIAASQVPTALGMARGEGRLLFAAVDALSTPSHWSLGALTTTILAYALLRLSRRWGPRVPTVLLLSAGLTIVAHSFPGALGPVVGSIPAELPRLDLNLPWERFPELLLGALVIAIVGFTEPTAIARRYQQPGSVWNPSRELIGQGLANIVTGMSAGMPVGASFSRSALNVALGAHTRWAAVVTGVVVLMLMPLAGLLSELPRAVLAAVVLSAITDLLRIGAVTDLWRFGRMQTAAAITTTAMVLLFEPRIDLAVVVGVMLSVLVHLAREGQVSIERSIDQPAEGDPGGAVGRIEVRGNLWFANAAVLEAAVRSAWQSEAGLASWVLDLRGVGWVDVDAALTLGRLRIEAERGGLDLKVIGADARTRLRLRRFAERPPS